MKTKQLQKNILTDWQQIKLGGICDIFSGGTPDTTNPDFWGGEINWITPTEITRTGKYINLKTEKKITELGLKNSSARLLPKGSLIICTRATVGECSISTYPISTNQGFKNLIPKKDTTVDYLYYFVKSIKPKLVKLGSGSTFLEVSKGDIEKLKINLPPLLEQTRIVSVLETWDKVIENLNKKIEIKKQIKKGLMQDLLTGKKRLSVFKDKWEVVMLGNICDIKTGKKDVNEGNPNGKYPFFTCAKGHTYSDNYSFDTEAILIAGNGEVGNCLYYKGKFEAYQRTYVLSNFKKESMYIYQYLNYFFQNIINSQKQMGAMPYIKLGMLQEFEIKIPKDLIEQKEIANVLIITDKEIIELERKLKIIKDQKKYLLNNLITGTIRTPENLSIKT